MKLIVITGMSGAGKASAAKILEDFSYQVVDNLPPALLTDLVKRNLAAQNKSDNVAKLKNGFAAVVDSRAGEQLKEIDKVFTEIRALGVQPIVLFLDASDSVLVQRFKETRRRHPILDNQGSLLGSLETERKLLHDLRERADRVIDTSELSSQSLRDILLSEFAPVSDKNLGLAITIESFGFKYGLPLDADLVFDVRFLANPHYIDTLQPLDGRDPRVKEFVSADPAYAPFLDKLFDILSFSIPRYIAEGKVYLNITIGCTGGRHRSVLVAERLAHFLNVQGYHTTVQHRDVRK